MINMINMIWRASVPTSRRGGQWRASVPTSRLPLCGRMVSIFTAEHQKSLRLCVSALKKRSTLNFLSALAALIWGAGCASLPPADGGATTIAHYQAQAVKMRGLELQREISIERETREQMRVSFVKELEKDENREFLSQTELLLHQFRLLPHETSLAPLFLELMNDQVAAYYDPEKKRLVAVDGPLMQANKDSNVSRKIPGMERFVYVHEFCHAIEDDHFDLERLMRDASNDLDSSMALTAFTEGNAMLVGLDGLLDNYGVPMTSASPFTAWALGLLRRLDLEDAAKELEGTPPFLISALVRPYLDGTVFCNRLRYDAGWGAIDCVYTQRLPATTAEILYPERRYLAGFQAATFEPDPGLLQEATHGISTNRLGALGIALWLNGDRLDAPSRYSFLRGWMGDCVYFLKGERQEIQTVWLSLWERPSIARAFCRAARRRLKEEFAGEPYAVQRDGARVAIVWGCADAAACDRLMACARRSRVDAERPGWLASVIHDLPLPLRLPHYPGFSSGVEVLGGWAVDVHGGEGFFHGTLAGGLLRTEWNPDRHAVGAAWGLLSHTSDACADYTYWRLPLLASWHRRGSGETVRYRWRVLGGVLADGDERRVRLLFVPVWRGRRDSGG